MQYAAKIERDGNGYMVSFHDIPEALTGAETYEEAVMNAQDALVTAFEFYFDDGRSIPMPSTKDGELIEVPLSVWSKVLLLNAMLESNTTQTELANRMGVRKQEIQRYIDLHHATKIDTIANAIKALGRHLDLCIG